MGGQSGQFRPVVPGCAGCAMAHPDFGRSVNPISTRPIKKSQIKGQIFIMKIKDLDSKDFKKDELVMILMRFL